MKLFLVHPMFWFVLLVLWALQSETEANNPDVCQQEVLADDELIPLFSSSLDKKVEAVSKDNFLCALYPSNTLNCSWSFHTLKNNTQLSVYISICDDESAVQSLHNVSAERVGSSTLILPEYQMLSVVIHFNLTLDNMWTVYAYKYLQDSLEKEVNNSDVCQQEVLADDELIPLRSSGDIIEEAALEDNFLCVLYPNNTLICSWSFHTLNNNTQLSVYISICDEESAVQSLPNVSAERVGSRTLVLPEYQMLSVVIHFNLTLDNMWTVYAYKYLQDSLEVLPPPQNISASVKDGGLLVTWSLPHSRKTSNPSCFEYQLDIGDQESPKMAYSLSYTELNIDPSYTYRVRIRTRKKAECTRKSPWSDWSDTVTVEQSVYKLSALVIVSISLGIPMILLAVLLLGRYQRVSKVLFPPIPRPPPKYKSFLEKSDMFNLFRPPLSAEPDAEITEVEDAEQNLGKKF